MHGVLRIAMALLLVGICSCSPRQVMVGKMAGIIDAGIEAFEADDDLAMLEQAFPANIKLLEALLENSPENRTVLVLLARFYAGYAFVFFEGPWETSNLKGSAPMTGGDSKDMLMVKDAANRYYLRSAEYALRALEVDYPDCRERLIKVTTRNAFFKQLSKADVPALFWYGFSLGSYANMNRDQIKALSMAGLAEKAMERVIELDQNYHFGSAHLFLLVYYASRPPMLGGNLNAALSHYKALKTLAGNDFLLADLYFARYYLYQKQEKETCRELLTSIVHYPKSRKPYRLYNKVATVRAESYLGAIDRLFD